MTPDEVVSRLKKMSKECCKRIKELVGGSPTKLTQFPPYHSGRIKLMDENDAIQSAISLIQDYQKLRERVM